MRHLKEVTKIWFTTKEVEQITGIKGYVLRRLAKKNPGLANIKRWKYRYHKIFVDKLKGLRL